MALTKIDDRGLKTPIDLLDNEKIRFGTGNDLEIYHDGSHSRIKDTGTGNFILQGNEINLNNADSSEYCLRTIEDGAVELYYNGSKKFETYSGGVRLSGELLMQSNHVYLNDNTKLRLGTSQDLNIYHDGSHSRIHNSTGALIHRTAGYYQWYNGDGSETLAYFNVNGSCELYYDGSKKLYTESDGIAIDGNISVESNGYIRVRATGDNSSTAIQLGNDGTASFNSNLTVGSAWADDTNQSVKITDGQLLTKANTGTDAAIVVHQGGNQTDNRRFKVTVDGSIYVISDSAKLNLGASNDLQIYHDGSNSYLQNTTGFLIFNADAGNIDFRFNSNNDHAIDMNRDGAVELYYDNVKKFETNSVGCALRGTTHYVEGLLRPWSATNTDLGTDADRWRDIYVYNDIDIKDDGKLLLGNGDDLQIYHNGTSSLIDNKTGHLYIRNNVDDDDGSNVYIEAKAGEQSAIFTHDAGVELRYDNVKKFETTSGGILVSGNVDAGTGNFLTDDNGKYYAGSGGDLEIYHTGSDSFIENATGDLYLRNTSTDKDVVIQARSGEHSIVCRDDAAVELYYDNVKKFETISQGIRVQGTEDDGAVIDIYADEGDDNEDKWRLTATTDGYLHIQSYKYGTWHAAASFYGGGAEIQRPYLQAGQTGLRFDRDQQSPTNAQWGEYNGDGHLHRSDGQSYLTVDDHFRIRHSGSSENKRFEFHTDQGHADAQNDWRDDQFDFAEFFEWSDGNPDGEDRIGNTVAVDGLTGKIKIAESGDTVIGVVSGTAAFTANCAGMQWQGAYKRDEWGRYELEFVKDADGNQLYNDANNKHKKVNLIENSDWDKTKEYYTRDERKEWDKIGLIGQCYIRKTAVKPSNWIKLKEVDSVKDFYLIK